MALALKAFYSRAGGSDLLWILAPSAWLARFVGGIDLVYEQGVGFISHAHHLVVGPACAGVNFLIVCLLCFYFSFARHFTNKSRWLVTSLFISYGAAVAANGLRIVVAAHLWDSQIYRAWMTPEEMHRCAGIVIYYASLMTLYFVIESRFAVRTPSIYPLLWYVGITLGLPLVGRAIAEEPQGFATHAAWVVGVAVLLTAVKVLSSAYRNRVHLEP
jgi:exosortase K